MPQAQMRLIRLEQDEEGYWHAKFVVESGVEALGGLVNRSLVFGLPSPAGAQVWEVIDPEDVLSDAKKAGG